MDLYKRKLAVSLQLEGRAKMNCYANNHWHIFFYVALVKIGRNIHILKAFIAMHLSCWFAQHTAATAEISITLSAHHRRLLNIVKSLQPTLWGPPFRLYCSGYSDVSFNHTPCLTDEWNIAPRSFSHNSSKFTAKILFFIPEACPVATKKCISSPLKPGFRLFFFCFPAGVFKP